MAKTRTFWSCALLGLAALLCSARLAIAAPPGAGAPWAGYPALTFDTIKAPWLIVKCRLNDVSQIPAGLDDDIDNFLGKGGVGFGNIQDYFHDVSYNRVSVFGKDTIGWITTPFGTVDLQFPNGRLRADRAGRLTECLNAIPRTQLPDLSQYHGVVGVGNQGADAGACATGKIMIRVGGANFSLACVWFNAGSLQTEFAAHEIGHGLGLDHSFDDTTRDCDGRPGEYCDQYDIMSAQRTLQFRAANWPVGGVSGGGGPGLSVPGLLAMD